MGRRLISILFWAFLTVSSVVLFLGALVVWAITLPFDRRKVWLHRFTCFWASLYTWLNPVWRVSVSGREKLDSDRATILVANHQSLLDILVLFRIFSHFKWVSKIENFRVPLIGWNMSLNRYIKLKRGDRQSVVRMMESCERTLSEGSSIMIFPEGTRSPTGRMRAFKPGAFELAKKTGCPIQPIVIQGTSQALPKRGFVLQGRHEISVRILDPVPLEQIANLSVDGLSDHVRGTIAGVLEDGEKERECAA